MLDWSSTAAGRCGRRSNKESERTMRSGAVIVFRDKKDLSLAYVAELSGDKCRLITEKGKEFSFPADKILLDTGRQVGGLRPRDDIVEALAAARRRVDELRQDVVLGDLWELLAGSEDVFEIDKLAADYFGAGATGDHRAAMLAELLLDSVFFKQKGDSFIARPEDQVREIKRQKDLEERRARERDAALVWFSERQRGVPPGEPPAGLDRYLGQLKNYVLSSEGTPENSEVAAFIKELGLVDQAAAFELLARAGLWSEDANLVVLRNQVPETFSRDVEAYEAEVVARARQNEALLTQPGRADFTALDTFTIDDAETLDIDDALSLEQIPGGWRVGIHIADVAEYVKDSDPLDTEAFRRGQTLYMPDRKIPMLPESVSCDAASLVAGELRPAVSVMVEVDDSAYVRTFKLTRSTLRVRRRLSYDEVDGLLATEPQLATLLGLAQRLKQQRLDAGALVFNVPDVKVRIDPAGTVFVKKSANDTDSHLVVSEMMILANRLVAEWFIEQKVPALFRVQHAPDEPMVLEGYNPVAFFRLRRLIKRTEVSPVPKPHAGLGLKAYVQMTSPIRRYADLTAHRQIRGLLAGTGPEYSDDDIRSIMNAGERAAEVATLVQRESHRYWLLKYLRGLLGTTIPALVLDRRDDSYIVQLTDFLLETPIAQRPENRYEQGEAILVKVSDVDPRRGILRCQDAGRPPQPVGT